MQVRMKLYLTRPGVQYSGKAGLAAEVFGIGKQFPDRSGDGGKERFIRHAIIPQEKPPQ